MMPHPRQVNHSDMMRAVRAELSAVVPASAPSASTKPRRSSPNHRRSEKQAAQGGDCPRTAAFGPSSGISGNVGRAGSIWSQDGARLA